MTLVTYTDDLGEPVVVIRDVPADVCARCGEQFFNGEVVHRLTSLVEGARSGRYGREGTVELRYARQEAA